MYKLLLLCVLVMLFILAAFVIVFRRKIKNTVLFGICIASFIITMVFPFQYVLRTSILMDQVTVTALDQSNENAQGTDIAISSLMTNFWSKDSANAIKGKWAWEDGFYFWSNSLKEQGIDVTKSVTLEIPVGYERYIVFRTGPDYGLVEVDCDGQSETLDLYKESYSADEAENQKAAYVLDSPSSIANKDKLIRVAILTACEILIIFFVTLGVLFARKRNFWKWILHWKYEAFAFLLCLINIVRVSFFPEVNTYPNTYYFLSYENGFSSRRLVGAVTSFLFGPYIDGIGLAKAKILILGIIYLTASILVVRLAKKQQEKSVSVYFTLLFLCMPMSFLPVFDDLRPDIYLIILFFLAIAIIVKKKFIQFLPVICVLMMLINETSCCFFIASILALLLYRFFRDKDVRYLISGISSLCFTGVLVVYYLFVGKSGSFDADQLYAHLFTHTNSSFDFSAIRAEDQNLSWHMVDNALFYGNQLYDDFESLQQVVLYFIMQIPLVVFLMTLWRTVYRKLNNQLQFDGKKKKLFLLCYALLALSSLGGIACMVMGYDLIRFTIVIIVATIGIVIALVSIEDIQFEMKDFYLFQQSKREMPALPWVLLLYMSALYPLDVWTRTWGTIYSKIITIFNGLVH